MAAIGNPDWSCPKCYRKRREPGKLKCTTCYRIPEYITIVTSPWLIEYNGELIFKIGDQTVGLQECSRCHKICPEYFFQPINRSSGQSKYKACAVCRKDHSVVPFEDCCFIRSLSTQAKSPYIQLRNHANSYTCPICGMKLLRGSRIAHERSAGHRQAIPRTP